VLERALFLSKYQQFGLENGCRMYYDKCGLFAALRIFAETMYILLLQWLQI